MRIILFAAFVSFSAMVTRVVYAQSANDPAEQPKSTESPKCDCDTRVWTCNEPRECAHGLVPDTTDPCACCRVCGNGDYSYCDLHINKSQIVPGRYFPYNHKYGICGEGLTCKTNFEVHPGSKPENICFCDDDEMVCGTNGKTYDNICILRQKNIVTKSKVITEASRGRCPGAPKISTAPRPQTNSTGGRAVMHCEIVSNPVPVIEWRKDGFESCLPGDSSRMVIYTRGGPDEFEHTSFLQMLDLQPEDEGVYRCVTRNSFGNDTAGARLTIRP